MSTLKVTNIQATGETVSRAVAGVAAAYVRANGDGTIQESQSLNVASSTDHGAGDYSHSLTNALDTRGVQVSTGRRNSNGHITAMNESRDGAGLMAVRHFNTSDTSSDGRHIIVLYGDLA